MEHQELKEAILNDGRVLNEVSELVVSMNNFLLFDGTKPANDMMDIFRTLLQMAATLEDGEKKVDLSFEYLSEMAHSIQLIQEVIHQSQESILSINAMMKK